MQRRAFVSMVADRFLSNEKNELKWGIVETIRNRGVLPEIFFNPKRNEGLAANRGWTPERFQFVANRCDAGVLLGFPRWKLKYPDGRSVAIATEYNQYEGSYLKSLGIPLLVLVQSDVLRRGVYDYSFNEYIVEIPNDANVDWLDSEEFNVGVDKWMMNVNRRKDVFLGYCMKSSSAAEKIKAILESEELGVRVLDWRTDFPVGSSVLDEITLASQLCKSGIFLFSRDDMIEKAPERRFWGGRNQNDGQAIPRDNVVFEAGYFMGTKGPDRVLIIRQEGAKMPADLGGRIYATYKNENDISLLKNDLLKFKNRVDDGPLMGF